MQAHRRLVLGALVAFVAGALLALPVVGYAHCDDYQGSHYLIIVGNVDDADFYASSNRVNTDSLQTWGAPWCQITDTHYIQRYENGAWVTKSYARWTNYKSVDSGWHPGYQRVHDFYIYSGGSYRYKCTAYRISSHNQLFGLGIGDQFQHLDDTHSSYQSGSL